jgi:phage antirepressor YoqD-like protein
MENRRKAAMNDMRPGDMITVQEAAAALGVSPEAVKKHIRELYPELLRNGLTTYLTEAQITAVKRKMLPTTEVAGMITDLEAAEMLLKSAGHFKARFEEERARRVEAEVKLAEAAPKVEFFDQVADSKDAISLRDTASTLNIPGWGRNKVFALLREKGVIDGRNIPYREYQDRGLFRVIEQTWTDKEGETHISLKTLVYQKGIAYINALITRSGTREAAL